MKKRTYIIANWKSHPETVDQATALFDQYKALSLPESLSTIVCPPAVFLPAQVTPWQNLVDAEVFPVQVALGIQNIAENNNTCTGEITATQIASIGVKYAIVGHSERRARGETDTQVHQKIRQCLDIGITPIVCVGESVRDELGHYVAGLTNQLDMTFAGFTRMDLESMIIAYEPIWAIGTGATRECTVEECRETIELIRAHLIHSTGDLPVGEIRIVYGGSVNPDNAQGYLADGGVDGLLIGRASLDIEKMKQIIQSIR